MGLGSYRLSGKEVYRYRALRAYISLAYNRVLRPRNFVLGHPNGREGKQQYEMRPAAIAAGLVANESEVTKRISFVTEGAASLHFCLNNIPDILEKSASEFYSLCKRVSEGIVSERPSVTGLRVRSF